MRAEGDQVNETARIREIVEQSARGYIESRRARVAPFCSRHFSPRGAWDIHRKALGHDLWRAPVNVLWALPYLLSRGAAQLSRKLGWARGAAWLEELPPGFETSVAREVEWLVYTELLELPLVQDDRRSDRDALLEAVLSHETIAGLLLDDLAALHQLTKSTRMRGKLEHFLAAYTASRTAAGEMAASLLSLAAGAAAFQQITPSAAAIANAAAAALAQHLAIANFALGPALGSLYYGLFPASASASLVAGTVGTMMAVFGVLTALTGIVADPIQQAIGLHERRLQRLLTALEGQLTGADSDFRLRDAYVARIFDILDVVRAAVRALRS